MATRFSRLFRQTAVAALLFCAVSAEAQNLPGDPVAGYMIATESCAACHVVADGVVPPFVFDVPSFFAIANDPAVTALAIKVFLRTPHARMPNLILKDTEGDDVASYILSLRGRPVPPPYVLQPPPPAPAPQAAPGPREF